MSKFFPVFRPGTYTDSKGKTRSWSKQDIEALYNNYDPEWLRAAFSTDHKQDGPAMGYATKLMIGEDGTLFASADDLSEDFRDEVKKKKFGRVSVEIASFKEKGPYLKGISFLGVKMPAVKGMEAQIQDQALFQTADDVEKHIFETTEAEEFFELGDPVGDSDKDLNSSAKLSAEKIEDENTQSFEELQLKLEALQVEKAELESRFEQTDAERKQAQERLTELSINTQKIYFEQWLNERIAYGSVTPAQKDKIMDLLMALESVQMFSEGEAPGEKTPVQMFQEFVEALPKILDEKELARKGDEQVDLTDPAAIARDAQKYQAKVLAEEGRQISVSEAVAAVTNQNQK